MSEKKNKPQPPKSDVLNRTTYTVQYEIDGERYFEERIFFSNERQGHCL